MEAVTVACQPKVASPIERTFLTHDGEELFYRAWLSEPSSDKALLLLHRGHEHSGRFSDVVEQLGLTGASVFAWDARGHGRSPGERGYARSFATVVRDIDDFARHIATTYSVPMENMVVLGHSVGAVAVGAWVHDYAPPIRGMILVTPALRVKLYVPLAIPGLRLLKRVRAGRRTYIKSYVKSRMLTHDPEQAARYDQDPLVARSIAVNILLDLHDTSTRLIDDAGAIRVPTLVLSGSADWVVKVGAQRTFFERLGTEHKHMRIFDGMYHDVLHEKDREPVLDAIRTFAEAQWDNPSQRAPLIDADRRGYTYHEFSKLSAPLPAMRPKRLGYAVQRLALRTVGRLSDGVRLGWRTGFDSGKSLDYVYENVPRGKTILGRLFDRAYLNSAGWRGIRCRKIKLEQLLGSAIARLNAAGRPVHIVDIATGCGRYVLAAIGAASSGPISACLRDNVEANLEAGRTLAKQMNLSGVKFELGNAFDGQSLSTLDPPPTLAIVSGLYELIPDNQLVLASLRGLAQAMQPGGYLIYTGQPWHPQLEMIARVLINRDQKPWIMRRRTQEELDDLVRSAGFEKIEMRIDDGGIFTVSLARIGEVR